MTLYRALARPLLFRLDPERTHERAIRAGRILDKIPPLTRALSALTRPADSRLESEICGIRFPNPVGLAAGYDKSGHSIDALSILGFGFIEIGSVSADPSAGNPRPRLWRLPRDRALCVHYGLPNDGAVTVAGRLAGRRFPVPLGINLVKTNRGIDAPPDPDEEVLDDYVMSARALRDAASYLALNLSCPNTETGRDFFAEGSTLPRLLERLRDLELRCPVFLKVSPPGGVADLERLLAAVDPFPFVSGFIFNLPPGVPPGLRTRADTLRRMRGAVSGKPVERLVNDSIRELYSRMDTTRYRIIGAGGVFTAEDAYEKIRLGASLVQLLTAMIYEGPWVVRRVNRGLAALLARDGFVRVSEAVGTASCRAG